MTFGIALLAAQSRCHQARRPESWERPRSELRHAFDELIAATSISNGLSQMHSPPCPARRCGEA